MEQTLDLPDPVAYLFHDRRIFFKKKKKKKAKEEDFRAAEYLSVK